MYKLKDLFQVYSVKTKSYLDFEHWSAQDIEHVLSLGHYDGVHRGHQFIFEQIPHFINSKILACTFACSPRLFFAPDDVFAQNINTLEERLELLGKHGVDEVLVFDFAKVKDSSARDFLQIFENDCFKLKMIICGSEHRFGKGREGSVSDLHNWAKEQNIKVSIVEPLPEFLNTREKISSSKIRKFLINGYLKEANEYLGYMFFIQTKIIKGASFGAKTGFPTINCFYPKNKIMLPFGVYARFLNEHLAAINFGLAPSLKNIDKPVLEGHLLDLDFFQKYSSSPEEKITIKLKNFIRPEKKFETIEELKEQINLDCMQIKNLSI